MSDDVYVDDAVYHLLVTELAMLEPDPVTGVLDIDQIKLALAEIGGIFPASIQETA